MNLSTMLRESVGKTSGVVYATGVMKGREVLRMVADCRAQETIRVTTARILSEGRR